MKYPNFHAALVALAETPDERAALLGVSRRTYFLYASGAMLPPTKVLKRFPALDIALTWDFARQPQEPSGIVQTAA